MKYQPSKIEKKWQAAWKSAGLYSVDLGKGSKGSKSLKGIKGFSFAEATEGKKYYLLVELPYPSGDLHMGHWFTFAVTDILGRMKRMQGYNVFFPVGFDAFGLPAENAAIKRGINPREWTYSNIETMKTQFATMGGMHDFEHGVITCDPEYYRWNQWIFIKMFEKGLAYRGKTLSNWCPSCQTVLANENVEAGHCWRCGTEVIQKEVDQWFLKITDYAERLLWPSFAEATEGKKERADIDNVIIVPGCPDNPGDNKDFSDDSLKHWIVWTRKTLTDAGIKTTVVQMPKAWDPVYEDWKKEFEKQKVTEKSVLIGHSCGGAFLSRWLSETGQKVRKVILVAPSKIAHKNANQIRKDFFDFEIPSEAKNKAQEITIFVSNDDSRILESVKIYKKSLGARVIDLPNKGHFLYEQMKTEEFPELLDAIGYLPLATGNESKGQKLKANSEEPDWPQSVREGQNNWIGKSEGLIFSAPVKDTDLVIETFSAHFEACYADTFVVIAPDHPFLEKLLKGVENREEVEKYCKKIIDQRKNANDASAGREPEGIFTGRYIVDPLGNGDLPIWVANYALRDYGTGIVKCSCHDERDFAFAKKYDIALKPVLFPKDSKERKKVEDLEICFTDMKNGILSEPAPFKDKVAGEVRAEVADYAEQKGFAKRTVQYHLHDWSISRQRYWGTPIPAIYCINCWKVKSHESKVKGIEGRDFVVIDREEYAIVPVPEKDLPVVLPEIKDYAPKGKPPLATAEDWVNVKCPNCGGPARREVDTMDTFVDSSWYFLRYVDPKNQKEIFDENLVAKWVPVELYVGGAEHTLGHTLYSRFFVKFLHDIGQVPFDEYAKKRIHHGVILGPDGARMSKSKGNVVNPDEQVSQFGADAVRMYLAFMGPYDLVAPWNPNGLRGVYHFLQRVWELSEKFRVSEDQSIGKADKSDRSDVSDLSGIRHTDSSDFSDLSGLDLYWMHKTIKKVGEDISATKYNTAVAALMEWLNWLSRKAHRKGIEGIKSIEGIKGGVTVEEYKTMLLLIAPFAPHMAEELWQKISQSQRESEKFSAEESIHNQPWPVYDPKYIAQEKVTIVLQVNGKVRDQLLVEANLGQEEIEKLALAAPKLQNYLGKKTPQKIIFIPGKLLNIVV